MPCWLACGLPLGHAILHRPVLRRIAEPRVRTALQLQFQVEVARRPGEGDRHADRRPCRGRSTCLPKYSSSWSTPTGSAGVPSLHARCRRFEAEAVAVKVITVGNVVTDDQAAGFDRRSRTCRPSLRAGSPSARARARWPRPAQQRQSRHRRPIGSEGVAHRGKHVRFAWVRGLCRGRGRRGTSGHRGRRAMMPVRASECDCREVTHTFRTTITAPRVEAPSRRGNFSVQQ